MIATTTTSPHSIALRHPGERRARPRGAVARASSRGEWAGGSPWEVGTVGVWATSERVDQPLDTLVVALEGVLQQDGALRLVVELEVHPVDRVVAPALLGPLDERAAQARARRLGRDRRGLEDRLVGRGAVRELAPLELVEE